MADDKGNGKKGFAGLDSMVSNIDTSKSPASEPIPRQEPSTAVSEHAPTSSEPAHPQPAYTGNQSPGSGSGKWWAIGIGLIVFFIWVGGSDKKTSVRSPSHAAPAPAPYYLPAAPARTYEPPYAPKAAPAYASNDEERPPVGSGLSFNRSQIRYCLSEKIRMSTWQAQVNEYSETSVDAFNKAVHDYNMRCSNFRYRSGTLESVRSEVEANRSTLQLQGMASAAANP